MEFLNNFQGTSLTFGAKDKASKHKQPEYQLVLEDQIDFIKSIALEGTRKKKKKKKHSDDSSSSEEEEEEPEVSEAQKKKLSIQEVRRSLPVYPFRGGLLEAIEEYQVSISHPVQLFYYALC